MNEDVKTDDEREPNEGQDKSIPQIENYSLNDIGQIQICHYECGDTYVSDGIGDNFQKWDALYELKSLDYPSPLNDLPPMQAYLPKSPVFVSAQTGKGKNHFIGKVLIPYLEKKYDEMENEGRLFKCLGNGQASERTTAVVGSST